MNLLNSFDPSVRTFYIHDPMCIDCRLKPASELHHIFGRGGTKRVKFFSSPFNAAPLCRECHAKDGINSKQNRQTLIWRVADFLLNKAEYSQTNKDYEFLNHVNSVLNP